MYSGWPRSSTGVSVRVTVCVSDCDHLADPPASITQNRTLPSGPPSRPVTTVNSTCTGPTANCSPDSRAACASRSSARKPATNAATGTRPSSSPTVTPFDDSPNRGTAPSRREPHPASHSGTRREGRGPTLPTTRRRCSASPSLTGSDLRDSGRERPWAPPARRARSVPRCPSPCPRVSRPPAVSDATTWYGPSRPGTGSAPTKSIAPRSAHAKSGAAARCHTDRRITEHHMGASVVRRRPQSDQVCVVDALAVPPEPVHAAGELGGDLRVPGGQALHRPSEPSAVHQGQQGALEGRNLRGQAVPQERAAPCPADVPHEGQRAAGGRAEQPLRKPRGEPRGGEFPAVGTPRVVGDVGGARPEAGEGEHHLRSDRRVGAQVVRGQVLLVVDGAGSGEGTGPVLAEQGPGQVAARPRPPDAVARREEQIRGLGAGQEVFQPGACGTRADVRVDVPGPRCSP